MLTDAQKSDVMRHLGYPAMAQNRAAIGSPGQLRNYQINASISFAWQRLDELTAHDEAKLTGDCLAVVGILGELPATGNQVNIQISSTKLVSPVSLSYTAGTSDDKFTAARVLVAAVNQNTALASAGFSASGAFYGAPVIDKNALPQVEIRNQTPFSISVSSTGLIAASVLQQGEHLEPSAIVGKSLVDGVLTDVEKWGYIAIINHLQKAVAGVTRNADVARAGDYYRGRELKERKELLNYWRNELSTFLDLPFYRGGSSSHFVL